jgi:hypothetical protein
MVMKTEPLSRRNKLAFYLLFIIMLLVTCFCTTVNSHAANHYISSGATGANNGTDWTNAWTDIPAMTSIGRGDSVYIADGTYAGTKNFNKAAGAGLYIYLVKATVANHGTATGWSDALGDGQAVFTGWVYFSTNDWIWDGQTGTGADTTSTYGFKVDRSATHADNTVGMQITSGSDTITIKHTEIVMDGEDTSYHTICFYADFTGDKIYNNILISNCYFHDVNCAFIGTNGGLTNSFIQNNYMQRRHTNSDIHGEAMSISYGVANSNTTIRNNIIKDVNGTGGIVIMNDYGGVAQSYFNISGNLIFSTNPARYEFSNGAICNASGDTETNINVYNNTIANCGGINQGIYWSHGTNNRALNNLFWNNASVAITGSSDSTNAFINQTLTEPYTASATDIKGTTDPFVNSAGYNFHIAGDDSTKAYVIGRGTYLGTPYDYDLEGTLRANPPTIGAYAYESGDTTAVPPEAPVIAVNRIGGVNTTFTITPDGTADYTLIYLNDALLDSISTASTSFGLANLTSNTSYSIYTKSEKDGILSGASNVINWRTNAQAINRVR